MEDSSSIQGGTTKKLRSLYEGNNEQGDTNLNATFGGPYGIVDPRFVGYNYVSYMFINSGEMLDSGFEASTNVFRVGNQGQPLMLGPCLGEYDFIHRRVDTSQYFHADFSVHAIDNQADFGFVKNVETYPVFSVGRWHGKNIRPSNITLRLETDEIQHYRLDPIQAEFLYEMVHNPGQETEIWEENIRNRITDDREVAIVTEKTLDEAISNRHGVTNALKGDYYLGESISIDVPGFVPADLNHVLVGLSVGEGVEVDEDDVVDLPNEKVICNIRNEFDGWRMPYIVSGVGKEWGDILVEMHITNVQDMNRYAKKLRNIDGVVRTKTFVVTKNSFNSPFIPETPKQILNREMDGVIQNDGGP